jgi:hypothetical protein
MRRWLKFLAPRRAAPALDEKQVAWLQSIGELGDVALAIITKLGEAMHKHPHLRKRVDFKVSTCRHELSIQIEFYDGKPYLANSEYVQQGYSL